MEDRIDYDTGEEKEYPTMSGSLLLDSQPLVIIKELACEIGLNEAIVFQQLHYWIRNAQSAKRENNHKRGRWWVYNSIREWQEQFPFWSENTIRRALGKLEEKKLVISAQLSEKKTDRRKWYAIDYEEYTELLKRMANAFTQNEQMDLPKMSKSSYTENTTEIESGACAPPPEPANQQKHGEYFELCAWILYGVKPEHLSGLSKKRRPIVGNLVKVLRTKYGATLDQVRAYWKWYRDVPSDANWQKSPKKQKHPLPSDITDYWSQFMQWYEMELAYAQSMQQQQIEQETKQQPAPAVKEQNGNQRRSMDEIRQNVMGNVIDLSERSER